MNYQKIYDAFIANRRVTEHIAELLGYSEKHHILPRSLGGGNEPSNLIRLTVRDHYFAHCCLAKIHGGNMWAALRAMTQFRLRGRRSAIYAKGRFVEVARRNFAELLRQQTKARWLRGDFKDRPKFAGHTAASKAILAELSRGRECTEATRKKIVASQQVVAPKFDFVHLTTGEEFHGTQLAFQRHAGVRQASASKIATERAVTAEGWALLKNKGVPPGLRDFTIRVFAHKDGARYEGLAYHFTREFGLTEGNVGQVVRGVRPTVGGWRYVGEKA